MGTEEKLTARINRHKRRPFLLFFFLVLRRPTTSRVRSSFPLPRAVAAVYRAITESYEERLIGILRRGRRKGT